MIVVDPGVLRTIVVIVRVLIWCDFEAHLIKETHCNSLEVLIELNVEVLIEPLESSWD